MYANQASHYFFIGGMHLCYVFCNW